MKIILFLFIISLSSLNSSYACNKDLEYLKNNFDELAQNKKELFNEILLLAKDKAYECSEDKENTKNFLSLAKIRTSNAEFQEFFSESIENLLFKKPLCFFDSLVSLDDKTITAIIEYLKYNSFHEPSKIEEVFIKYQNLKEYKKIMDIFFH